MIIAVASGKGGTGKTTVALSLARVFGAGVQVLDCDVEEPNAHLFLNRHGCKETVISIPVPTVDESLCNGCGKCSTVCEFNAIVCLGKTPLVFAGMCHGCGGCTLVCPTNAIREVGHRIGVVETSASGNILLIQGRLDVGKAMAPPLIRAVKSRLHRGSDAILDAPPGTSCPVVATLRGADCVVLVTEPTPFGLHDLTLAVDVVQELQVPFGVVINRADVGDSRVHDYCGEREIPVLTEIPDDRQIAEAYSRGELLVDALPEYRTVFTALRERIVGIRSEGSPQS